MERQLREFLTGVFLALMIAMVVNFFRTLMTEEARFEQRNTELQNSRREQALEFEKRSQRYNTTATNNYESESKVPKSWQIGPAYEPPIDEPAYTNLKKRVHILNFSGMKAKDIIDLRTKAVRNSKIMAQILPSISTYEPRSDVYNLQDGKQWISAYQIACHGVDNNKNIGRGFSRESIGILNPEFLFYLSIPSYTLKKYGIPCSDVDYHIPESVSYNSYTDTITVKIDYTSFYNKHHWYWDLYLTDANARDLGYNYAFADRVVNAKFEHENNLSQDIIMTRGYYHTGSACGLPEGCSNYSPREMGYDLRLTGIPAEVNIKLWKERPQSTSQRADLNYRMIFE